MSFLSSLIKRRGASGFGPSSTAEDVTAGLDLHGRTILITGVTSGIGQESARVLALRGARVIAAARTLDNAAEVARVLGQAALPIACDLSEPASVRACVAELQRQKLTLDVVLCNAGIMAVPKRTLKHGQELQFLTNHLGHFILVTGLLEQLSAAGRVVLLSSEAHRGAPSGGIRFDDLTLERRYSPWSAYGQSKLANLLFTRSLARRFSRSDRTANAVHPGVIATNLTRHMNPWAQRAMRLLGALAFKDVPQGAATSCYVAAHPALQGVCGAYFKDCNIATPSRYAQDDGLADRLWKVSEEIVAKL
jgi:NAD(P)-dependent dehydrogenase (short-subunit alcohol dehydrogenase family)